MIGNFDDEAQNILNNAKIEMNNLGHPYVGTEHLLLSILNSDNDIVNRLNEYDLTYNSFKSELCKVVGVTEKKAEFFLYTLYFVRLFLRRLLMLRKIIMVKLQQNIYFLLC